MVGNALGWLLVGAIIGALILILWMNRRLP